MPLIQTCRARDCETLTMGEFCLEHEHLLEARLRTRAKARLKRLHAPLITLAFAVIAAFVGRASARFGA